jgi:hypothetical protein
LISFSFGLVSDQSLIGSGYHESGAGAFDLDVDSTDELVFSATPGLELGARLTMPDGSPLRAYAGIGLSLLSANNWEADARFEDAPASAGDFRNEVSTRNVLGRLTRISHRPRFRRWDRADRHWLPVSDG